MTTRQSKSGEHGQAERPPETSERAHRRDDRDAQEERDERSKRDEEERRVDEASDESFPASDPPAFTSTHAGEPQR